MSKLNLLWVFFAIVLKLSVAKSPASVDQWVVWDIGQGQWVTHVLTDECIHYDIGGELGSFQNIRKSLTRVCGAKKNFILLSHWDFDHYLNLSSLAQVAPDLCWLDQPALTKINKSIKKLLGLNIHTCTTLPSVKINRWSPSQAKSSNDFSSVHLDSGFLMSGDSPIQKEKMWARELTDISHSKILILGHHGSRTSTGADLLKYLPNLKMAIASARKKKYGHPHKETLARLSKNKTPVLKTEDWGSIWFY
ncbi:MAG: hydrolase [Bdellovibrio sp.]|nr:hydrolase [Bdellovibrio sp.]